MDAERQKTNRPTVATRSINFLGLKPSTTGPHLAALHAAKDRHNVYTLTSVTSVLPIAWGLGSWAAELPAAIGALLCRPEWLPELPAPLDVKLWKKPSSCLGQ